MSTGICQRAKMRRNGGKVKSIVLHCWQPIGINLPMTSFINLCLIIQPTRLDPGDFGHIARVVQALDPSILITILTPGDKAANVKAERWNHRSVTIAIGPSGLFTPLRGPILQNGPVPKLEQYSRFLAAGVATPRTARFEFGKLDCPFPASGNQPEIPVVDCRNHAGQHV